MLKLNQSYRNGLKYLAILLKQLTHRAFKQLYILRSSICPSLGYEHRKPQASAQLTRTSDIKSIIESLAADSLLILDIDNCVLTTNTQLGRDQWYDWIVKQYRAKGETTDKALQLADARFNYVQAVANITLVDAKFDLPAVLSAFQDRGGLVMGLTARNGDIADLTHQQLASLGIHFSDALHSTALPYSNRKAVIKHNIIFCDNLPKGDCFLAAQKAFKFTVTNLSHGVFIDDKVHNCHSLLGAFKTLNLGWHSVHYDYAEKHHPFGDAEKRIARLQETTLLQSDQLVSDVEATATLSLY